MQDLEMFAVILIGLAGGIVCAIIGALNGLDILRDFGIGMANLIVGVVIGRNYPAIIQTFKCWFKKG